MKQKADELEEKTTQADFWADQQNSGKILREIKQLKDKIAAYESLVKKHADTWDLNELAIEEADESFTEEILADVAEIEKIQSQMRIEVLLSGEYDKNNAILELHPGAGGTESMDWAGMLYRMYSRWAEKKGFKITVLDFQEGEEAGVKSCSLLIEGDLAYGYLKAEKGVHRLVRISPFDSSGRRHTSFASLDVMPQFSDDIEIVIEEKDLDVITMRASGAGGQHINKTDSAVRMTHKPTGIVVSCQTERSQIQNRERCLNMLKSKLYQRMIEEQEAKLAEIRGEQKNIEWGSQIRSYVFCPYTMVKDHRTNYEMGSVQNVMDGDLDGFIFSYLKSQIK